MIINTNPSGAITISDDLEGQIDTTQNKQQEHVVLALGRLIEFWKNKPNIRGLLQDYMQELQILENAVWQVIVQRFPDNAGTAQLDVLGKIVGEPRNGLTNSAYLPRIRARIKANGSFGHGSDVIAVVKLMLQGTLGTFHFIRQGVAGFRLDFIGLLYTDAVMGQLASMVEDTAAAGVGVGLNFTPADNGHLYANDAGGSWPSAQMYADSNSGTDYGGVYCHAVQL